MAGPAEVAANENEPDDKAPTVITPGHRGASYGAELLSSSLPERRIGATNGLEVTAVTHTQIVRFGADGYVAKSE